MTIVELLLDTARADTDLLIKNDEAGDRFSVPRTVDFLLIADTAKTADAVSSFIMDNQYAQCRIDETDDGKFHILAQLEMPITQNVACAASGLFACISKIFKVEYDGWAASCVPHRTVTKLIELFKRRPSALRLLSKSRWSDKLDDRTSRFLMSEATSA